MLIHVLYSLFHVSLALLRQQCLPRAKSDAVFIKSFVGSNIHLKFIPDAGEKQTPLRTVEGLMSDQLILKKKKKKNRINIKPLCL